MRECLRTGKPYELPANVRRLIDEGAIFQYIVETTKDA